MKRVALSSVAGQRGLVGGPFGSSLVGADYVAAGIPVIRGSNLGSGRYVGGEFAFVTRQKYETDLARNTAIAGDIVYTQRGTLGQVALVPAASHEVFVVSQSQMRLRVEPGTADARFIYYASTTQDFLRQIQDRAIATGVPHINLGILSALEVPLPPFPEQQAIAEVLGALDDKIAANTALATTADALANGTYAKATSSWPNARMSDVLSPILGGTPARNRSEYWHAGDQLWVSARDITSAPCGVILSTSEQISALAGTQTKAKPLPAGSVILTARGTVGEVGRLARPAAFNQSCYGFKPDVVPPNLLYFSIVQATEMAKAVAHGSVFDTITKSTFDHLEFPWEPQEAATVESQLSPLLKRVTAALEENRTLAATRDALLPKLMSGALRVRDAEKIISEAGV